MAVRGLARDQYEGRNPLKVVVGVLVECVSTLLNSHSNKLLKSQSNKLQIRWIDC